MGRSSGKRLRPGVSQRHTVNTWCFSALGVVSNTTQRGGKNKIKHCDGGKLME